MKRTMYEAARHTPKGEAGGSIPFWRAKNPGNRLISGIFIDDAKYNTHKKSPRRGAARSSNTPEALISFIRILRCPKFWDAAPSQTRRACLGPQFFMLERSEFAQRQGFARWAKHLDGAERRPIKDGAPDVELQEAAARQGP